jgi:hypothetical protein
VPPPAPEPFHGAIRHRELWLWDSWTDATPESIELFCLALSRVDDAGGAILPRDRNDFAFHVRRFCTRDRGGSWVDLGAFVAPSDVGDGYCARNVWSGSALRLSNGDRLHALTGLRERGPDRHFVQTLFVAFEGRTGALSMPQAPLLCPERDGAAIRAAGYYLGPAEILGANEGEEDGPILAWRDPYLYWDEDKRLQMVWSAKIAPCTPALGRATLRIVGPDVVIETLHPPMLLPDADRMTQAEVPKVYQSSPQADWLLLVSACDRQSETQPDGEVSKVMRLYRAERSTGPWRSWRGEDSHLPIAPFGFGASIFAMDPEGDSGLVIAPLTEIAPEERQLTFAPAQRIRFAG